MNAFQGNGVIRKTGEMVPQQRQSQRFIKLTSHVVEKSATDV